jgi:hypothetical protein
VAWANWQRNAIHLTAKPYSVDIKGGCAASKNLGGGTQMDIAALSVVMNQSSLLQAAGLQVMSIAKDQAQTDAQNMVQMLSQGAHPTLGKTLDIRA